MKATLTFDLTNEQELKEYENIIASKDLIKAIQELYYHTQKILNDDDNINYEWAKHINYALVNALSDYNLDIRQF